MATKFTRGGDKVSLPSKDTPPVVVFSSHTTAHGTVCVGMAQLLPTQSDLGVARVLPFERTTKMIATMRTTKLMTKIGVGIFIFGGAKAKSQSALDFVHACVTIFALSLYRLFPITHSNSLLVLHLSLLATFHAVTFFSHFLSLLGFAPYFCTFSLKNTEMAKATEKEKAQMRDYYLRHKEEKLAKSRQHYRENHKTIDQKLHTSCPKCGSRMKKTSKLCRKCASVAKRKTTNEKKARKHEYHMLRKEEFNKMSREWYLEHHDEILSIMKTEEYKDCFCRKPCPICGLLMDKYARLCQSCNGISMRSENNHQWKGDDVGYASLHDWVRSRKPKSELCEKCHKRKAHDLANISGEYKRDITDFEWLCRKCHMESDGRFKNLRQFKV